MLGFILRAKDYFSHVQDSSWHYQIVEGIWNGKRLRNSKACSYYWIKFPTALIVSFLLLLVATVFTLVLGFTGHVPVFIPSKNEAMLLQAGGTTYPYKHLPNGWKLPIAPWEVMLIAGVIYALYYTFAWDFYPGLWLVIGLAVLCLLMGCIYVLTASWNTPPFVGARSIVKEAWDRVCPPLVIEHDDKDSKSEED